MRIPKLKIFHLLFIGWYVQSWICIEYRVSLKLKFPELARFPRQRRFAFNFLSTSFLLPLKVTKVTEVTKSIFATWFAKCALYSTKRNVNLASISYSWICSSVNNAELKFQADQLLSSIYLSMLRMCKNLSFINNRNTINWHKVYFCTSITWMYTWNLLKLYARKSLCTKIYSWVRSCEVWVKSSRINRRRDNSSTARSQNPYAKNFTALCRSRLHYAYRFRSAVIATWIFFRFHCVFNVFFYYVCIKQIN